MPEHLDIWPPFAGVLFAFLCLLGALRSGKKRRLIDNLPTCKTSGVFIGLVEVKGTAETPQPFVAYLSQRPCVYYHWEVQEHWSRTVTETETDSDGKTRIVTRHESGWRTIAQGGELGPFYLQDDCGFLLVRPEGSKIEPLSVFNRTCGTSDPYYYGKGPSGAVADSDYRRQFTEQAIPIHTPLYVLGQARERSDIVAPEIAADKAAPMFLISTRTEEQVSRSYNQSFWLVNILGAALVGAGFWGRDAMVGLDPAVRWPIYAIAAAGYVIAAWLGWFWMVYNSLIELRQRVRQAWSLVDVQLKRRHDLIPNLVDRKSVV